MKYITLFIFGCYCVLASYAYGTTAPSVRAAQSVITAEVDMEPRARAAGGYARTDRAAVVKLWNRVERDLTKREAAETLAKVYGITAGNADAYQRWWK